MAEPITSSAMPQNTIMEAYTQIREGFLRYASATANTLSSGVPTADKNGFITRGGPFDTALTSRVGGFDKLFDTLVNGIVDDPDYAMKKDWRIYERIGRDPQIFYCLMVRKAATAGLPWTVMPPTGYERDPYALKFAQAAEMRIRKIPRLSSLLGNLLEALLAGLAVCELVWEVDESGYYVVRRHYPMNKDRFKFTNTGALRLLQPNSPNDGKPVPDYKFIVHTYSVADGSWKEPGNSGYVYFGRGLADTPLYHYFYFKTLALKYYLQSLERYGNPTKLIWSGGQNPELATKLTEVMLALKNDSVINIPGKKGEVDVEIVKSPVSAQLFSYFIEYVDRLITRAILGQDLMTENISSTGSRAASQVHKSVFGWIAEEDKNALQQTLNETIMTFDAELNTPNLKKEMRPVLTFKQGAVEDAAMYLQSVQLAQNLGLDISLSQLRERTGLREPVDANDVLPNIAQQQQQEQMAMMQEQGQGQQQPGQGKQQPKPKSKPVHKGVKPNAKK
jgi:phage gp29-like protein